MPDDDFKLTAEQREEQGKLDLKRPAAKDADNGHKRSGRRRKDTARLVWDSKPKRPPSPRDIEFQTAEVVIPNPARDGESLPYHAAAPDAATDLDKSQMNRLIWGDNLLAMQALIAQGYEGKVNLIYIDPPFDSGADYSHNVDLLEDGTVKQEPSIIERIAYADTWEAGVDSYLDMLFPRLQLCRRLLSEHGSIYFHCDWHCAHAIRFLLDECIGAESFVNEIAWCYSVGGKGKTRFGRKHDTLFFYSMSENRTFNGKHPLVVKPRKSNSHMRSKVDADGREYQEKTDRKSGKVYRYYVDEGKIPEDWWSDIEQLNREDAERAGFNTQKPERLLERVIACIIERGRPYRRLLLRLGHDAGRGGETRPPLDRV